MTSPGGPTPTPLGVTSIDCTPGGGDVRSASAPLTSPEGVYLITAGRWQGDVDRYDELGFS